MADRKDTYDPAPWAEAMVKALSAMSDLVADQKANIPTKAGGSYEYSYVNLAQVLSQARNVLSHYGLAVQQSAHTIDGQPAVTTYITHTSGHTAMYGPLIIPAAADARQIGSAITYARRYALMAVLGLATEDDDGAAAVQPARETPVKEQPTFNASEWLAIASKTFTDWTEDERKTAGKAALAELKPSKPMTQKEASAVHDHMAKAYYAIHEEVLF